MTVVWRPHTERQRHPATYASNNCLGVELVDANSIDGRFIAPDAGKACPLRSRLRVGGSAAWVILPHVAEQLMGDTPSQTGNGPRADH